MDDLNAVKIKDEPIDYHASLECPISKSERNYSYFLNDGVTETASYLSNIIKLERTRPDSSSPPCENTDSSGKQGINSTQSTPVVCGHKRAFSYTTCEDSINVGCDVKGKVNHNCTDSTTVPVSLCRLCELQVNEPRVILEDLKYTNPELLKYYKESYDADGTSGSCQGGSLTDTSIKIEIDVCKDESVNYDKYKTDIQIRKSFFGSCDERRSINKGDNIMLKLMRAPRVNNSINVSDCHFTFYPKSTGMQLLYSLNGTSWLNIKDSLTDGSEIRVLTTLDDDKDTDEWHDDTIWTENTTTVDRLKGNVLQLRIQFIKAESIQTMPYYYLKFTVSCNHAGKNLPLIIGATIAAILAQMLIVCIIYTVCRPSREVKNDKKCSKKSHKINSSTDLSYRDITTLPRYDASNVNRITRTV